MNRLFRAVGGIDDALIEEAAAPPKKRSRIYWIPVAVSAAAAAAIAGLFVMNARRTPQIPLTPNTVIVATQTDPAETETPASVSDTTVFFTEPTGIPPAETTASPSTVHTTSQTTRTPTLPTAVPTTAHPTVPTSAPTTIPTTAATSAPTTVTTAVPTTQTPTVPTTGPTSTVPTTAPTTVAPTTVPVIEPTIMPVTDPEPETELPTRMQPEGEEWVVIGGKRCFPLRDAALSDYNVAAYLGRVVPQSFEESAAEEGVICSAPLGEEAENPAPAAADAPHEVPFSPFPELEGAKVYLLIPFPGASVAQGAPRRHYLIETETQNMIYAN
ncbi:MAG: hypothetical protein IJL26_13995 [Clostridia bacterium]|nr:hypothetical protein [Clostridia bacterium]